MKAHCLQHELIEDMGAIEAWLLENNFEISYTRFFEHEDLPLMDDIDWIIIMGGSMSVNDENIFPWLAKEKAFIKKCISEAKVVIGVCLGSQLIASSLDCKVYKNPEKEIGWYPIYKIGKYKSPVTKNLPDQITVFHWHGETFDLPSDAELIASSAACKNQMFTVGRKVIAMQCHLETTAESLSNMSNSCKSELIPGNYIQSEEEMKIKGEGYYKNMHKLLFKILDEILIS